MNEPVTRAECIDHLRRAALGIRSHLENPRVVAMHTKADDGYLADQARRAEIFDYLAAWLDDKKRATG
jgi:hypothetical protein